MALASVTTTICFNGWSNITQRPLLNVIFAYPNVFISSTDTIGEQKDVHYICNALTEYIEVDTIVQICTYNASNMRSVTKLLIHHCPSFYFQGCATHYLDLLLEN
jgi:hypothetical protein